MDQKEQLHGAKAWDFRRQTGFTKALPQEIQKEAAELANKGLANLIVAHALGVIVSSDLVPSILFLALRTRPTTSFKF